MSTLKFTFFLLLVPTLCLNLYSCTSESNAPDIEDEPNPLMDINLSSREQTVVENSNAFALNLLQKVANENCDNMMVSPYSVANMLAILANDASDEAQAQIATVINGGDSDLSICNELYPRLAKELPNIDKKTNLQIANGFICADDIKYVLNNAKFLDIFDVDVIDAPLQTLQSAVNSWVAENTNNFIKGINVPEFNDESASFAALNAVFFKSTWTNVFSASKTKETIFNGIDHMAKCKMLYNRSMKNSQAIASDNFLFARIPFGNKAFSYIVAMPNANLSLAEGASLLYNGEWDRVSQSLWSESEIEITMPKFTIDTSVDLTPMLQDMGIEDIFDLVKSPLLNDQCFVASLSQSSLMELDEKGATMVSASTASGLLTAEEPRKSVTINRPFFFFVQEQSTRTILFMGKVSQL